MNTLEIKTNVGEEGIITLANYNLDGAPERAYEIDAILKSAHNLPHAIWKDFIAELSLLCGVRQYSFRNRVVVGARTMQVGRLIGVTTYSGTINYGALGTGSTAVADGDTLLDTEVARKLYASRSQSADQCTIDFYYSKSDTNGTYNEFGMFIDGTATLDSGLMFNRALTGGWTKSSSEAMTVSVQININAV